MSFTWINTGMKEEEKMKGLKKDQRKRTKNRIKARSGNEEKKRGLNQDQEVRKRRESKSKTRE